ncbi:hypothetical protein AAFC00_005579 [Neodothiora populina]|uniref:BHLH domain-containing protein n=1 Tax=Neodothiora populina TaxID=2781224 RepID=A0ABR3PLE1_9PEZI
MPFRHANAYGGYDYPTFPTPGGFDFINYDTVADPLMSPYDAFSLTNSSEVAWTPTSQNPDSQHSESLSPLELNFATSNNVSPASRGGSDIQQLPLDFDTTPASSTTGSHAPNRDSQNQKVSSYQTNQESDMSPPSQKTSQQWSDSNETLPVTAASRVAKASDAVTAPVTVPIRQGSAESGSEASDHAKDDRPEPTRTRTTDSAKVRHNIVERRYRENINAQVDVLRDSIVATMEAKSSRLGADELKRLTKAAVIAAATQQIKRARTENDKLLDEHRLLQSQIKELESLVKCGECPLMQLSVDMGLESSAQTA